VKFRRWLLAAGGLALACSLASAAARESSGADLARRLGCFACHSLNGRGAAAASRLDGIGGRLSPAELQMALTYPRRLHPGAKMPSYAYLPLDEIHALIEFLQGMGRGPGR
jgi:cbb3-type cytochrome oxidase cytochrome c subunit